MRKEFAFIDQLLKPLAPGSAALGLTDDAAALDERRVIASDALLEGVHFLREDPAETLAHKLLAVNLSDMLAMGARPSAYLMSLFRPAWIDLAWEEAFARGLAAAQDQFGLELLGGDTVNGGDKLAFSVTMIGERVAPKLWLRSGAQPGQRLALLGRVGGGWCGLQTALGKQDFGRAALEHYRRPQPPLHAALQLAKADLVRSAIDISDGLLQDAEQMARASGCGMELDFDALPLWSGHADPLTQATGGDDYSLLVALKPGDWAAAQFALPDLHPIGRCCEGEGVVLRDAQGRVMPLGQKGWEHAG